MGTSFGGLLVVINALCEDLLVWLLWLPRYSHVAQAAVILGFLWIVDTILLLKEMNGFL